MNKITINDIAAHAGVSKASVSYVLSGTKRLKKDTEERVMKAVEELGYTPPKQVTRLQKKQPKLINFCLPLEKGKISDDPYYIPLIEGAMEYAVSHGYHLMLTRLTKGDEAAEQIFFQSLDFIDGCILCNLQQDDIYEQALIDRHIPYVVNGTPIKVHTKFYVDADIEGIAYQASSYLLKKGHQKIQYINLAEHLIQSQQRLSGFMLAHREFNVPWEEDKHHYCNVSMEESYDLMKQLLRGEKNYVSAIVTSNEIQARGAIKAIQEHHIAIPQQMAVVSMGGSVLSVVGHPRLTTIDFSPSQIGYEAAKMLIEVINKKRIRPSQMVIPGKLIVREST